MAWSSAELSSTELALLAADKPLVAVNAFPVSPDYRKWIEGSVGAFNVTTNTDRTDSDYPNNRSVDRFPHYVTKPSTGTVDTDWYFAIDTGASDAIEFDCAFVIGHNWDTLTNGPLTTADLEIADSADFVTNKQKVGSFTLRGSDKRLQILSLYHTGATARRYTDVRYVRLVLCAGGNIVPEIGELILGRRRQLEYKPDRPFDDKALRGEMAKATSAAGVTSSVIFHKNKHVLDSKYVLDSTTYASDWETFYQTCNASFVWLYDPSTYPNNWRMMHLDEYELDMPLVGPGVRDAQIIATEQGPERFFLEEEA